MPKITKTDTLCQLVLISVLLLVFPSGCNISALNEIPAASNMKTDLSALPISVARWDLANSHLAIVQNNMIFTSNLHENFILAFDLKKGEFVWQKESVNLLSSTAMVTDHNNLYFVIDQGITALNQLDGSLVWERKIISAGEYQDLLAIQQEGLILYSDVHAFAETQTIYALDAHTGQIKWHVNIPGSLDWFKPGSNFQERQRYSALAYNQGQIYLRMVHIEPLLFFSIITLNPEDGTQLWHFNFGIKQTPGDAPSYGAETLLFTDTDVYIPIFLGPTYVVNPSTGTLHKMIDQWWHSPVDREGKIFTHVSGKGVMTFDSAYQELWVNPLHEELVNIPELVVWNNHIIVENFPQLIFLDLVTGQTVEKVDLYGDRNQFSDLLAIKQCDTSLCLVTSNSIFQLSDHDVMLTD